MVSYPPPDDPTSWIEATQRESRLLSHDLRLWSRRFSWPVSAENAARVRVRVPHGSKASSPEREKPGRFAKQISSATVRSASMGLGRVRSAMGT